MVKFLRKLLGNERGNVIFIMAASLPIVIACAGLASDTIQWTLWKRQLQRAADSAALAGVYTRSTDNSQSGVESSVCNDLAKNQKTGLSLAGTYYSCADGTTRRGTVTLLSDSGTMTQRVQVSLTVQQSLPFSSMFLTTAPSITANATAASVPGGGDPCFLGLTTLASETGLNFTGNSDVYAPDCPGFSNASGANTAAGKGSAAVTLDWIGGVGGIQQSSRFTVNSYKPYSPALADPFIGVTPAASNMVCNATTLKNNGTTTTGPVALNENTVFPLADTSSGTSKATNCFSSLSVGANKSLTLPPNQTYYINGGDAFIQGALSCTACTIVMTNLDQTSTTTTIGQFKVNSTANVNVSAPASGPFAGIAIYQDRRAVDSPSNVNRINGNSGSIIQGALYFPNQQLEYNGTGTTNAICTMFVAKRIVFTGNSTTSNKFKSLAQCGAFGMGDKGAVRIVRLVA